MSRILKTKAFVLKKNNLLGKDTVISLFTEERGKIRVMAKGVKKITSRRSPQIQTGNLIEVILSTKKEYFYLQETKLISHFSIIKKDKDKSNDLYYMLFILDRLLPENQKEELVYLIFQKFMIALSKEEHNSQQLTIQYINRILHILGYSTKSLTSSDLKRVIEGIINEKVPEFVI